MGDTGHHRLLRIYLNDHLMGAAFGTDLTRRCLSSNRGTPLGSFLEELLVQIRQDRATLEEIMAVLDAPIDRVKLVAGSVAEKIARLKLNGKLVGYSDLSRVLELEGLCAGVDLKLRLWRSLQHIAATDPRLAGFAFADLIERASSQLARLERHRLDAAERAFA